MLGVGCAPVPLCDCQKGKQSTDTVTSNRPAALSGTTPAEFAIDETKIFDFAEAKLSILDEKTSYELSDEAIAVHDLLKHLLYWTDLR